MKSYHICFNFLFFLFFLFFSFFLLFLFLFMSFCFVIIFLLWANICRCERNFKKKKRKQFKCLRYLLPFILEFILALIHWGQCNILVRGRGLKFLLHLAWFSFLSFQKKPWIWMQKSYKLFFFYIMWWNE